MFHSHVSGTREGGNFAWSQAYGETSVGHSLSTGKAHEGSFSRGHGVGVNGKVCPHRAGECRPLLRSPRGDAHVVVARAVFDGCNPRSSLKCCHSAVKCPTALCFNHWSVERDINGKRLDEPRKRAHAAELPSSSKHENQGLTMRASKEREH